MKKWKESTNKVPFLMLGVSLCGFLIFYMVPFLVSLIYALVNDPVRMDFVGVRNFVDLFRNEYFMRGLKNTLFFMIVSIPIGMVLSLLIAILVNKKTKWNEWFSFIFLIPLVIPSAATAFFWQNFFAKQGVFNHFLSLFGIEGADWVQSQYGMFIMIGIFLWKNVGYNMALFISGLNSIPAEYYECASAEGAGKWWKFRKITWVYLTPTTFFVLIMSFVNSFKIFKEIYIMTGEYPPKQLYLLQHYMNHMFQSLNYPKLVSSVYILTIMIVLFVLCIFRIENHMSKSLSY